MACPKCKCKETYTYVEDDILGLPDDQERCAACGHVFFFEDHADEDDDDETPNAGDTALCRTDGRCQYAIDHGAEGLGHCPQGKCVMTPSVKSDGSSAMMRPAERGRSIKATMHHDAGAYARCSYCKRYSDKIEALNKDEWPCECGKLHGWSGSFVPPAADSLWSEATPNVELSGPQAALSPEGPARTQG